MKNSKTPISRRQILKALSASGAALVGTGLLHSKLALSAQLKMAKTKSDNILIWIILRGAWDGLNVVVPYGDPYYYQHRPTLGIEANELLKIDGLFGFNPALKQMHQMYKDRELSFAHAIASPYRSRSHFDGQKILENGTQKPNEPSGWLNRLIGIDKHHKAIAIDRVLPLILQGDAMTDSWYPNRLDEQQFETELLQEMLANNPSLSKSFAQAIKIENMTSQMGADKNQAKNIKALTKQAARFLKSDDENSPNIVALELSGWDTHAGQGTLNGRLANNLKRLETAIISLKQNLGQKWQKTVIIGCSEFGRTVKQNGTGGTDHGTGSALLLAGGAINGGQIITDWPSLKPSSLFEGRDLQPTMDVRSVFKTILIEHLEITQSDAEQIFPQSAAAKPLDNIIS